MPLEKTYEELLASKINSRNYSAALPVIYNLRKKSFEPYVPTAAQRIVFSPQRVGSGENTSAIFNQISQTPYKKGTEITLTGTATYALTDGTTRYIRAANNIIAYIDFDEYRQVALTSQIGYDGQFEFNISSKITQELTVGQHYVYIDASSPLYQTRLSATVANGGLSDDPLNKYYFTRLFTITD